MQEWFFGAARGGLRALLANESSSQIAAGVALGVVIGLTPKMTLLAFTLGVLLCALRVHRGAGLATAALVAPMAPLLDGFTHKLGLKVLTVPSLQPTFAWLYDAPLGPWWGLHNTVTCGSFLLGVYLSYPLFLAVRSLVDRLRPSVVRWATRYRLGRWLLGADVATRLGLGA